MKNCPMPYNVDSKFYQTLKKTLKKFQSGKFSTNLVILIGVWYYSSIVYRGTLTFTIQSLPNFSPAA